MQVIMAQKERLPALIDRAREGDRDAFDAIVSEYNDRLELFVRSRVRPQLRERLDAAELAHETFSPNFFRVNSWKPIVRLKLKRTENVGVLATGRGTRPAVRMRVAGRRWVE